MTKPYRFVSNRAGFRLVVFAPSLTKARQYVKNQAVSSISHRALRYCGEGNPSDPEKWCAAKAENY